MIVNLYAAMLIYSQAWNIGRKPEAKQTVNAKVAVVDCTWNVRPDIPFSIFAGYKM